jgi:hypothetical protein
MKRHLLLVLTLLLSCGTLAWQTLAAEPAPDTAPQATAAPTATGATAAQADHATTPAAASGDAALPAAEQAKAAANAPAAGQASPAPAPAATGGSSAAAAKTSCSLGGLQGVPRAAYWFGLAVLALVMLVLAWKTALLRDGGANTPWSLGRTQMAWWFFFVVAAFLYIWLVSGTYPVLTTTVLALIGISSGTALSGAVIDDAKQSQMGQRPALETARGQLQQTNAQLTAAAPAAAGQPTALLANLPALQSNLSMLKDIGAQLVQIPHAQQARNSFWLDILSDENGISFHRFQMVIWTLVLTTIFVTQVACSKQMPQFSNQLLGLMGISSGAYIGFKFPEKQA